MAYSESSKKATIKYQKEKLKSIPLRMKLDEYSNLCERAAFAGEPVTRYIKNAITMRMTLETKGMIERYKEITADPEELKLVEQFEKDIDKLGYDFE